MDFLQQYYLQRYLYMGRKGIAEYAEDQIDTERWNGWHCAILVETNQAFFDADQEVFGESMQRELHRDFFNLNLNAFQTLLLFQDAYCDYQLVANHIYNFFKRRFTARVNLAVSSKFEGWEYLANILGQLEQQMEGKYYHPEVHVFSSEEEEFESLGKEVQDSQLVQKISDDVLRRDMGQLEKHFWRLKEKYRSNTRFSAMYVKFVFSNVIQELFQENDFAEMRCLEKEIDRLYGCNEIMQILDITEENIRAYGEFLKKYESRAGGKVEEAKKEIRERYAEDVSVFSLAEKEKIAPGYLSFLFRRQEGMNMCRFLHIVRLTKARRLLEEGKMPMEEIAQACGFGCLQYFFRSFRMYYGEPAEKVRERASASRP